MREKYANAENMRAVGLCSVLLYNIQKKTRDPLREIFHTHSCELYAKSDLCGIIEFLWLKTK